MPNPPENSEGSVKEPRDEGRRSVPLVDLASEGSSRESKITARELPRTEIVGTAPRHWANNSLEQVIDFLERTKPAVERSMPLKSAGDRAQKNLYELLSKQLLPEMKKQGKLGAEWEIYPSVAQSPADKVGADFLLVNTKTGAFHFLDSTMKDEKPNVFSLRSDGVVVVDNRLFDAMNALKYDEGGAVGQEALKFKAELASKIEGLAKTGSPFKLGPDGTPMPSLGSKSAEQTSAEINNLADWAREQAKKGGTNGPAFEEMARVVSRASTHTTISQVEVFSPKFAETVQRQTEAEIARFIYSKFKNEAYQQSTGNDIGSFKMLKDGKVKMSTAGGDRLDGGAMPDHLDKGWQALIRDQKKLLAYLSNKDLQALGADTSSFAKLKGNERAEAIEKAYKSQPKFKQSADALRNKLHELRSQILAGGAVGSQKPLIVDNVVTKLKGRNEQSLLGIEAKPEAKAPELIKPAEQLQRSAPKAAAELASFHKGEKFSDGKFSPSVAETMELMILEQQSQETWSKGELEKFRKIHEAYIDPKNPGHADALKQVHEYLASDSSNDNSANQQGLAIAELESKLKGEPSFQKLTDQARMAEALKQMSDRALQRMPAASNEAGEFLTGQLRAAMRKQLGLNTDAELPAVLRQLQVKVANTDAQSVSVKPGANGLQVIEIPARLLRANPKGVLVDTYTQAAGLGILEMLNEKNNGEAGLSSLRPLLDRIAGNAEKVVGARSLALAQKPAAAKDQASSDRRVVLESGKPLLTSWDGDSLSFGGERFHMQSELAKLAKDRETRITELEREFKKASELAQKTKTARDEASAKALEAQLAAERQDLRVVFELSSSLSGQRGEQAKSRVGEMFRTAADRAIAEHFQSRPETAAAARSSAVMSRGAALAMVLTTLTSMYFAGSRPAQAQGYDSTFR